MDDAFWGLDSDAPWAAAGGCRTRSRIEALDGTRQTPGGQLAGSFFAQTLMLGMQPRHDAA